MLLGRMCGGSRSGGEWETDANDQEGKKRKPSPYQLALQECTSLACVRDAARHRRTRASFCSRTSSSSAGRCGGLCAGREGVLGSGWRQRHSCMLLSHGIAGSTHPPPPPPPPPHTHTHTEVRHHLLFHHLKEHPRI